VDIRYKYNVTMNDYLIGIGKRIKDIRKTSMEELFLP
jgi:hypothetical protein